MDMNRIVIKLILVLTLVWQWSGNISIGATGPYCEDATTDSNAPSCTEGFFHPPRLDCVAPHHNIPETNRLTNPNFNGLDGWGLQNGASFDPSVSHTLDGSGSVQISAIDQQLHSTLIPVDHQKIYSFSYYMMTDQWPSHSQTRIVAYDHNQNFLRNVFGSRFGTTEPNKWEEATNAFQPKEDEIYYRIKIIRSADPAMGDVWVDDFYFGEWKGFDQPPSPKKAFDGSVVRADYLGNIQRKINGEWRDFFPLCIHRDVYRPLGFYSEQGFNCTLWPDVDPTRLQQHKEAVSTFNPDGLMGSIVLYPYMHPDGFQYGEIEELENNIDQIKAAGLMEYLLTYWWDNEHHYEQWEVPNQIINAIRNRDFDPSSGKYQHPITILQGNEGLARVHAAAGMTDLVGSYYSSQMYPGIKEDNGASAFKVIRDLEGQTNPSVIAQLNNVNGAGGLRMRIYNAIISGARGVGYWRDCLEECQISNNEGPIDDELWWDDLPNIRRELDQLLPLIRQPHWTNWKLTALSSEGPVSYGTRNFRGEGYAIFSNGSENPVSITFRVDGLDYTPHSLVDYFSDETVVQGNNSEFTITLPGSGIESGTLVLRLSACGEEETQTNSGSGELFRNLLNKENSEVVVPISPNNALATVEIYDQSGQLVIELTNEGTGDIAWDGHNEKRQPVTSGIYYLVIKTKATSTSKESFLRRKVAVIR